MAAATAGAHPSDGRAAQQLGRLFGYGALAGLIAVSALLAAGAAGRRSFLVPAVHGEFPSWIAGPLAGLRNPPTRHGFALALVALCIGYCVALACHRALSPRIVLGTIVALHLVYAIAPPLLTADIFSYIDYGRLGAIHGINPYVHTPLSVPGDPVFRFVGWRNVASAYGPLFTVLSYPLALLGVAAALWSLKAIAALASLGSVALIWRCAQQLGRPPLVPAMLVGLNPVLLIYAVGGGHNDLLMLLLTLAGVSLALAGSLRTGAASVVAGAAIKASSIIVLPFMLAGVRDRARVIAGAAAATITFGALAVVAFGTHALGFFTVVQQNQQLTSGDSFPAGIAALIGRVNVLGDVRLVAHVALALALVYLLWRTLNRGMWIENAGWALLCVVASTGFLVAWYTLWPLPFAALGRDRRLLTGTLLVEALFLAHRLPRLLT